MKEYALIPAPADCDIVFQCTEHSTDLNSSTAAPGLWPHTARRSTDLQEFGWEVFNHPPYSPGLDFSDLYLLLHLKKFLFGQSQRFQNGRDTEMSVTHWFKSQASDFYDTGYKSWFHGMINVSILEESMLKNSSMLAVPVSINISIKLSFVSVNDTRETYFGRAS